MSQANTHQSVGHLAPSASVSGLCSLNLGQFPTLKRRQESSEKALFDRAFIQ